MNDRNISLARSLTYAGVLPFLILSLEIHFNIPDYDYNLAIRAYSGVIISFLCGIHWGVFLFFSEKCSKNLLLRSNGVALLGWVSVLAPINRLAFAVEIFCFLYLLVLDHALYQEDLIPAWFWGLRRNATMLVALLLFIDLWPLGNTHL